MKHRTIPQVLTFGDYMTLTAAATQKGCTPNALYQWLKARDVPLVKVGRTIMVHSASIAEYEPTFTGRVNKPAKHIAD
jgi:hypothetical protein